MGIIDGVKRAVTTAAENIKKATQAKAKEAQERRQSSGAKDKAEISSQAQEVGSKGSKVADLQDEKKVDPRTSKKPLELSGEQLSVSLQPNAFTRRSTSLYGRRSSSKATFAGTGRSDNGAEFSLIDFQVHAV